MRQVDRRVFEFVDSPVEDGVVCVRALVDLDLLTAADARDQLGSICSNGSLGGLVVEIGPECFVDVRGLRVLLESNAQLRARGGVLALASTSRALTRLVRVLELDGELPCTRTVQDARSEVQRRAR